MGKFTSPKDSGQGSRHEKGERGEGKRKRAHRESEKEKKEKKREETKMSDLYREEPLREGQPNIYKN